MAVAERLPFNTGLLSHSLAETEWLAEQLYRIVRPDAVVALYGPLGAGKTCFVRGVARAAGVPAAEVSSPSFTLINEYHGGETPIFHFDLYRLKDPVEFYAIGGDDYLVRPGILLIEWAENGGSYIPRQRYEVHFDIVDEACRRLTFSQAT